MTERILKVFETAVEQVQIVLRSDGVFTYRRCSRDANGWGRPGPDLGLYDTEDTAECEARKRVWWLVASD